jgi:tetratricopeptide (TPR) repeat protein
MYLGRALHALGEYRRAIDVLRPVVISLAGVRAQDHLGLPVLPAVFARSHLVLCLGEVGQFVEALPIAQEGIALARATGHPDTVLWAQRGLGLLHVPRGDWPAAVRELDPALAIARENELAAYVPPLASALGLALAHCGRLEAGLALLEEAVESAVNRKQVANEALVAMRLATGYLLAKRLDRAEVSVRQALELSRGRRERGVVAYALHVAGQISARRGPGEWRTAEARYTEALREANDLGMRPLAASCRIALGELLIGGGDRGAAKPHLEAAVRDLQDMGMASLLAHAQQLSRDPG